NAQVFPFALSLFSDSGEEGHVGLQRIAVGGVVKDQPARDFHFCFRDFVERINFRVVDDRAIESAVDRLAQENAVQYAPWIDGESERDVAYAQNGTHLGQLLLDAAHGFERLDAGAAIFVLSGRDRQRQRIEDQIHRANAVLLGRELVDALGDRDFLVGGKRHAVFVDGQRDHRRAIALGHGQDFGSALLAVFQVDRVDDGFAGNALQRHLDDIGLSGVHKNWRGHAGCDLFQDRADVPLLVLAHDGAAQVEHVRAFAHQLLRERENVVVLGRAHQIAEVLDARGGVHLFRYHHRLSIHLQWNRGIGAGDLRTRLHVAHRRLQRRARAHDRVNVFRRCSAAPANQSNAILLDKALVIVGELLGSKLVNTASAFVVRQSRIGKHRDVLLRVVTEIAHRVVHLPRAGGAVEADDIDVIDIERGQRGGDLCAQQHRAGLLQRDLRLYGNALLLRSHRVHSGRDGDLGLQNVLRGLDQQNIDARLNQRAHLLDESRQHRVKTDVAERWQLGRGANGSCDKARPVWCGELCGSFARQLHRCLIDLGHAVFEAELAEHNPGGAKGVGIDDVRAHTQILGVNVADHLRTAEVQHLTAVFFAPEIVERRVHVLNKRTHGAVVDDDALVDGF